MNLLTRNEIDMNYYKQGDAANADKIKAAFKKLGIDVLDFGFADKTVVYCSIRGCVQPLPYSINLMHILYSHPDYKELELPVEPKFKVGDWLFSNNGVLPILVKDLSETLGYKVECIGLNYYVKQSIIENEYHLWTIADANDGDVLMTTKIRNCPFIYRKTDRKNNLAYYYAGIDGNGDFSEGCLKRTLYHFGLVSDVIPATKEQRDLLFAKMKEAGYTWNEKKKELRKIQPHYDISNFKPLDKVLVRDADDGKWRCNWFSHYNGDGGVYRFVTTKCGYAQCIPFEGNEHLLGTTDMCDKQYINW